MEPPGRLSINEQNEEKERTIQIFTYGSTKKTESDRESLYICVYIYRVYQKVSRLDPYTANRWQYVNECALLGSRVRHHLACRVASLCEHWELHNTSVCQHVCPHVCDFSTDVKLEQKANIKFCMKLGKTEAETFEMIRRAYRKEALSRARCFECHACFKRGRTSLEHVERSGRTSTSSKPKNVETIRRLVYEDCRRTIKNIVTNVNLSYGTVQTILTCDLNMHPTAAKFVPRLLTPEQKERRVAICQKLGQRAVDDPSFMSRVITGDESWVCGCDSETKQRSSQWKSPGSPKPKKARQSRSATESMLIVFFDTRGIAHHEFIPEGPTVNAEFYCNVLRRPGEDIQRKRPELWCADNWLLHDDNAPSHRALVNRDFLAHKDKSHFRIRLFHQI